MFVTVPIHNAGASEDAILQLGKLRAIRQHPDVVIATVATPACEAFFSETHSLVILLPVADVQARLQAVTGVVDEWGTISTPT